MPKNDAPTVDAHQHFLSLSRFDYPWMTRDLAVLRRNYLPPDLRPLLDQAGVDFTIFVQAQHNLAENDWALQLAHEHPWIVGIVGWLDLRSPRLADQIERYDSQARFVGVRHLVQDEPDDRWLLQDDVVRGLKLLARHGLPYDLLLRPSHLKHVPELARRVPDLRMVVDHLAKPPIHKGDLKPWRIDMAAVARFPSAYCKLSGMITEADHAHWRPADLAPYVDTVLELFGPNRLMFGSDWPVCRLAGEYSHVVSAVRELLARLSQSEQEAIFGRNAIEFYRLALA